MTRTGSGLLIAGMVLGFTVPFIIDAAAAVVVSFIALAILLAGSFLFWRGRQHSARAAAPTVLSDASPDVLYLRDFRTDPSTLGQMFSALVTPALLTGLLTEEEQLAEAMKPLGDLVAIGKPGEGLPTPGAARMYASDEEWRALVSRQMQNARFVVIRAGSSEGVIWELRRAVELVDPRKLLLLVLGMKRDHYLRFRHAAGAILGVSLPAPEPFVHFGRVSGFIAFAADWSPSFLPMRLPFWKRSAWKPMQRMFHVALRPVFEASGVGWKEPRVSGFLIVTFAALGVFALMIFLAMGAMMLQWILPGPKPPPPPERYDAFAAASDRFQARLEASPELREAFSTADAGQARAISYRLANQGLRRLDDDRLVRRAALLARISAEADTPACAALYRGDEAAGRDAAMARLTADELDQWFDLLYLAMRAEVRQSPEAWRLPPDEIRKSFEELLMTLEPRDAELLSALLQSPGVGTLEEQCRAGRLLYGGIAGLPEPSRATLARALVW